MNERPLLLATAAIVGIVLGALALLRGGLLLLTFLAVGFDIAPRDFGLLVLLPAGALVLAGAVVALTGGRHGLLIGGAVLLLATDVVNETTYVLAGLGFSGIDLLSGVLTAVLVFLLLQPQVRRYARSRS